MERDERWPIAELARRVGLALADGYGGQANGRVRDVPDVRSIRWYSTIGLLDKPVAYRGRTALYHRRHLWQVVAVKRRQADGASLARIQEELAGASDERLAAVARVPDEVVAGDGASADLPASSADAPAPSSREPFWRARPSVHDGESGGERAAPRPPDLRHIVELGMGVAVVFSGHSPTSEDVDALRRAAEPLLNAAAARGLTNEGVRS